MNKFERIFQAEVAVRIEGLPRTSSTEGTVASIRLKNAKSKLSELLGALSDEEISSYAVYRAAENRKIAAGRRNHHSK